jgi:hypothetical protein
MSDSISPHWTYSRTVPVLSRNTSASSFIVKRRSPRGRSSFFSRCHCTFPFGCPAFKPLQVVLAAFWRVYSPATANLVTSGTVGRAARSDYLYGFTDQRVRLSR